MATIGTMHEVAAPLGSVEVGRLEFTRGASHLTIRVDGSMDDLYRARFEGKMPDIQTVGGTVTVRYRMGLRPPHGEIVLSGKIPWSIRGGMGMSNVVADLEDLEVTDLEISGGTSHVEVSLPRPKQAVRVRIGGGASDFELVRPAGVPVRVHIGGGVSMLAVDDFRLGAGGKTDWRSPDYEEARGRYDIHIGAGASNITIGT